MILESLIIGFTGTILGTGIGLMITYYVQEYGIDYSEVVSSMSTSSMVMPNISVSYTHLTLPTKA